MSKSKKSIIVTGGAGFIGSNLARRLLGEGYKVWVIDNLSTGFESNIPVGAEFIEMDIADLESYRTMPGGEIHALFHLAAQSSGEISDEKPEVDLMTNALGTLLLLKWCLENNVPRFVYASSMAVYGDVASLPVNERETCQPLSLYGVSKLTAENYVRHFSQRGLKTTIFRMFSVYGPGQDLSNLKQGMVSIYMSFLLNKQPILVKGSKERFRDFIYIDDVIDAWIAAIDNEKTFGKTYNLGTGKRAFVWGLIEEEIRAFGYDLNNYPVIYAEPTPADQFGLCADITQISSDLNWSPKVSLAMGIEKMAKWAKAKNETTGEINH